MSYSWILFTQNLLSTCHASKMKYWLPLHAGQTRHNNNTKSASFRCLSNWFFSRLYVAINLSDSCAKIYGYWTQKKTGQQFWRLIHEFVNRTTKTFCCSKSFYFYKVVKKSKIFCKPRGSSQFVPCQVTTVQMLK